MGCDKKEANPTTVPATPAGNTQTGKVPEDIAAPKVDDFAATQLLNDAFAGLEKHDVALVEAKLAEVEKLKNVSPGINDQVKEIRDKLKLLTPATMPSK